MDLTEAIRRRRMVRHYTGAAVPPDSLHRIVGAALAAPSAGDSQGISLITVTEPGRISEIAAACGEDHWVARGRPRWMSTAGALVVLCLEPDVYRSRYSAPDKNPAVVATIPWWWVDGGAALEAILIATVAEGLAAGFQGGHRCEPARPLLAIPEGVIVLGIVTIGEEAPGGSRPAARSKRSGRAHRERW